MNEIAQISSNNASDKLQSENDMRKIIDQLSIKELEAVYLGRALILIKSINNE